MKQLTFIKKGLLQWWEVDEPRIQSSREAIVRPFIAARCDGDVIPLFKNLSSIIKAGALLHYLDPLVLDAFGKHPFKGPYAIGHECVGEIIELSPDISNFKIGDKVIVPWSISCGHCVFCHTGLSSKCKTHNHIVEGFGFGEAMGPWGGMISDFIRVPFADTMLVKVPDSIDPLALASASDNIPDAWRTVAPQLLQKPQAPVLVMGGGARSIGLYSAAIAVAMGATYVDYLDDSQTRLDIAESIGANPVKIENKSSWYKRHMPKRSGVYPISVDASGTRTALQYALRSLSPGGICTSVGFYFQKNTPLPIWQMYCNNSSFATGLSNPRSDLPSVLNLIQQGKFKPEKITTMIADWDDAHHAYLERTTKLVIKREPLHSA